MLLSSASLFSLSGFRKSAVKITFDGITLMALGSNSTHPTVDTPPDFFTSSRKKTLTLAAARSASDRRWADVVPAWFAASIFTISDGYSTAKSLCTFYPYKNKFYQIPAISFFLVPQDFRLLHPNDAKAKHRRIFQRPRFQRFSWYFIHSLCIN